MKKIKTFLLAMCVFAMWLTAPQSHAQGTTAFTYQGQLHDSSTNANGTYTMMFKLYDAVTSGNQIGSTITTSPTLANGLFSVNLDFGNVFNGAARWLDITVTNGGTTQELSPRVQLLPAPYALYAAVAATVTNGAIMNAQLAGNAIATTNIQNGAITTTQIANGAVTNANLTANAVATANIQNSAVTNPKLAANAVNATNIASGQVVKSLNGLMDNVILAAGANVSLITNGNTLQISGPSLTSAASLSNGTWSASVGAYQDDPNIFGIYKNNSLVLGMDANGAYANTFGFLNNGGSMSSDGNGGIIVNDNLSVFSVDRAAVNGNLSAQSVNVSSTINFGTGNGGGLNLSNQLTITTGNLAINVTSGNIYAGGDMTAAAYYTTSDRNLKENFTPIDSQTVLERVAKLPISQWNFKQDERIRHIGPMAQDFFAAFNVGKDDKHIATVDEDGVALVAIQGLNEKLKEKDAQIEALNKRLADLEQLVKKSAQK